MSADHATPQISEETRAKRAPWVMALAITIGVSLFALISNPSFASWLSGT